jgi:hypothetical protein
MHQPRTRSDLILYFFHGINTNLFAVKSKPINGTSKLNAVVQKILNSAIHFTMGMRCSTVPLTTHYHSHPEAQYVKNRGKMKRV